jgi:hypothetical protein
VFTNLKEKHGLQVIVDFIVDRGMLEVATPPAYPDGRQ